VATITPFCVVNSSDRVFKGWTELTAPLHWAETLTAAWRYQNDTRMQAAFIGPAIGLDARRAYVLMQEGCPAAEQVLAELVTDTGTAGLAEPLSARPKPVPLLRIQERGGEEVQWTSDQTLTEGPLSVRRVSARVGPIVVSQIAWRFADEPWTRFEASWLFSDPSTQALQLKHEEVFGGHEDAYVHVYGPTMDALATKLSAGPLGWARRLWPADTLGNGQGHTAIRGVLLHYMHARPGAGPGGDGHDDLQSMEALQRGDVRAVAAGAAWEGSAGPFRAVPALSPYLGNGRTAALDRYQKWKREVMDQPLDPWAVTTMGMRGNPGGTGAQEDFPIGPAPEILSPAVAAPYGLAELEAAGYAELRRPIHYREADGSRIDPSAHPSWRSWCQQTHFHPNVSPDRLGKPEWWGPFETHGYLGRDQQHNSINRLGAAVLIGGSRILQEELADQIMHWRAASFDAANRARGRNMHAAAWLYRLTGDAKLLAAMKDMAQVNVDTWPSRSASSPWAVDCSSFSMPDGRELGGRTPFWVGWAEALCAPGLFLGYRETGIEALLDVIKRSLRTLMLYGWFQRDGLPGWRLANGVAYRGFAWDQGQQLWLPDGTQGQALDAAAYAAVDRSGAGLFVEDAGDGFHIWAYPAVKLAQQLLPEEPVVQARCAAIIEQIKAGRARTETFDDMDRWMAVS